MRITKCLYLGCNQEMNPPAAADNFFYVCPNHLPKLVAKFKELGRPGYGPRHMPGCPMGSDIFHHPKYTQQVGILKTIADLRALVSSSTSNSVKVECWRTLCCKRIFNTMEIDGLIYALNPMQMQDSGVQEPSSTLLK